MVGDGIIPCGATAPVRSVMLDEFCFFNNNSSFPVHNLLFYLGAVYCHRRARAGDAVGRFAGTGAGVDGGGLLRVQHCVPKRFAKREILVALCIRTMT